MNWLSSKGMAHKIQLLAPRTSKAVKRAKAEINHRKEEFSCYRPLNNNCSLWISNDLRANLYFLIQVRKGKGLVAIESFISVMHHIAVFPD
ncbi:hypothetical protein BBD42_29910 [Paenibacillus sp. BIHB 4019]|uniref:Uncharacterized protein n=1 Tax=Paenibacillus sp. BIHB 4019 TaxID=1870819 RepID=A0A1B2DRC6_9BACL|nr:hypothetical protein BBD42_29910 [Paenibacillus sp. BIHB 4019]